MKTKLNALRPCLIWKFDITLATIWLVLVGLLIASPL